MSTDTPTARASTKTSLIKVGDTVVARNGRRGLRWKVTHVSGGLVTAERRRKGHIPLIAIYRAEYWRKRT
jgi:hypothetical protein